MIKSLSDPQPLRIFVVEDHSLVRKGLSEYLERLGHTVLCAVGIAEALKSIPLALCHVLICDINLPDGKGWELLERVELSKPIFAIAMSITDSANYRTRCKAAGFRYYLLKPFHPEELKTLLAEAAMEIAESE